MPASQALPVPLDAHPNNWEERSAGCTLRGSLLLFLGAGGAVSFRPDRQAGEVQYAVNQVTAPLDPIVHGPLKELIKVICLCEGLGYLPPALGQYQVCLHLTCGL